MKGYKAFDKGLVCKGKQYTENTVFDEPEADICRCGMHFCENPLDTLDYYPLLDGDNNLSDFAEVESLADAKTDDNKKFVTTRLKIGAKLDLRGFVKASIDFLLERGKSDNTASCYGSQLAASGYGSQLALTGKNSVGAAMGQASRIKGAVGSWITLAEYNDAGVCVCVKSAKIDGEILKADTWYTLQGGELVPGDE